MKTNKTNKNFGQAVIATENKHKLREIGAILKDFHLDALSMKDVGFEGLKIIEDGKTFEENALIKAKAVMKKTGKLAIADDSGLEVDILDNQPGIHSARFAGENATDDENNKKLLELLEGVPLHNRTARFVCNMVAVFPNGDTIVSRGECSGIIGFEPEGKSGFGYDPLFMVKEYNKTFAEMGEKEKNKISHRAVALEKLKEKLKIKLGMK
ncbi:MAG TPA: XTP/dITP diphosphatase [Clostridia bacterium]|nr:XTP/dITP diphosphatase [Clostridia bacterium]